MKRSGMKSNGKPRKRLNPVGKIGRENSENTALHCEEFARAGIFGCELRFRFRHPLVHCQGAHGAYFAHGKKRSAGRMDVFERRYLVALACNVCHDAFEGKEWMLRSVCETIVARERRYGLASGSEFFRKAHKLAQNLLTTCPDQVVPSIL